jgi:hypothetical protein
LVNTIVSLAKVLSGAANMKGRASITTTVTKIKIGMLTAKRIIQFSNERVSIKQARASGSHQLSLTFLYKFNKF